jgi:hypothetical protein
MKKIKQAPRDEKTIDILKRVAKRVEEATVDIRSIKFDVKTMKFDIMRVESNSAITKVDVEKLREELGELGTRLDKRITHVADLITISLAEKFGTVEKRMKKLEHPQQIV